MAKISTYPILSNPTTNDILIGTDVEDLNITKNFSIGSIIGIIGNQFVPYVGATGNVNLGAFNITASSFIVAGGLATQFVKADGSLDSTVYVPASRTLTINSVTFDLSANRSWDLNTINSLTTTGTSGPATYIGKTLNIPQYQAQGNYITQLSGEATAMGPGNATVTLSNLAVISKILTGLNITGGTIVDTDSILTAFGKVQNQLNGLTGGVTYQGTWNAATNTPTLTSSVGTKGYYYVVNVAGSTNLNGITDWKLGDWAIFNGSTWEKVDNTDAVVSVNGYTGAVVLTFSDVGAPPATRNLTINGVQFDLTADRTWTVGDVRTDQSYANPTWITSLAWTKITGTPTTLAGYGITDGVSSSRTLTINGVTYDLTANRTWNVGTVTSIATTGPLTGGTITGSGTIGITQAGASSDGYLSSTDWNTFNNKQNALTNPVTGTGTIFTLPMWGGATSLIDSPLSYGSDNFNFQYNSATGGSVTFTNSGLTAYAYTIQMNNFGSPRSTVHSYTDGLVVQSIAGTQVSRMFANGNLILGTGTVETGHKLTISGDLFVNTIINAVTDTDRFIVSDGGIIKYRTGAQLLSDIGAQGSLTLTTTGTSGAATLIGNTLNIPQYTDQFVGTVTSVGISMPSAFTVSNSPVTSAGTLTVVGAGLASQYVRGDGTLGDFPGGGGGGGSSVSYYLNGSVNQGTFVGNTYYEMSKVPVFGAGTDFNIATDGYVAQFITDANDPESLLIPAGNWNFELYFSASSSGGTPTFYVELYKYDGTTFTLIASSSANPELIAFGTIINPYFSPLAVPETVLAITDRLAIRVYVNNSGRTITLHTENSHLCQIITTFTTGLTTLNGLTKQVQYLATGTSGSDFNIASSVATHTFNLPTASAVNRGALSAADWSVFNGKQNAITLTTTGTSGVSTLIGSTLNIPNYSTDLSGYVTLATDQTITGLKTILRGGDVLNFKIGTDTLYGLKVAYNQNELVPSGEATWSFVNTFNRNGSGFSVTPLSFFRGVLVTGERLLSASVNTNLLDYYANNPTGRYPIYAYNTGVQQFASSIIVGETNGVVDAITGAIADLPAGVVANFKGRVIGSNAVNNNEFVTLSQIGGLGTGTVTSVAALTLGTSGTDLSSTVVNSTTTPVITLNVPTASAVNRGALSSADWTTFNGKVGGTGASGQVAFWNGTNSQTGDNGLFWDNTNKILTARTSTNGTNVIQIQSSGGTYTHSLGVTSAGYELFISSARSANLNLGQAGDDFQISKGGVNAWRFGGTGNAIIPSISTSNIYAGHLGYFGFYTAGSTLSMDVMGMINRTDNNNYGVGLFYKTAGTLTQGIGLRNNGNVLINTTTDAGFRLDVNGTARVQGVLTTTADAVVNGVNIGRGGGGVISNTRLGNAALSANTSGSTNTAVGGDALGSNTTGAQNTAIGYFALTSNNGSLNTAIGRNALSLNTTGANNTAIGGNVMSSNTTGSNNTAIGNNAGRYIADGTTAMTISSTSIFLGASSRANADSETNQIAIGASAIGLGSNTTVIGNSSTTFGRWFGNLLVGTSTNAASSILTMESTTQGFLPPRMTSAQRTAIASPAEGLIVVQTDGTQGLYLYIGAAWHAITML